MSISPDVLLRLAVLRLKPAAMAEVLSIIAGIQSELDDRRTKERDRKRKFRENPSDNDGTVTGQSLGHRQECPGDKKEIPPTPPKEKTLVSSGSREPSETIRRVKRADYPEEFEAFWKPYPRTPVMSKAEALSAWRKLSEEDRTAATDAVPRFVAWLKSKPDHPAVHACRFLSQRRFEGFSAPAEALDAVSALIYAQPESAELVVWDAHWRATKGKNAPRDRNGGWWFESQWPPGHDRRDPGEVPEFLRRMG